jgi:hypothetical protein
MCGIFAVLGLKGDPKLNRKRVYALAKRIRHRGPDSYNMDVRIDEAAGKGSTAVHTRWIARGVCVSARVRGSVYVGRARVCRVMDTTHTPGTAPPIHRNFFPNFP